MELTVIGRLIEKARDGGWREVMNSPKKNSIMFLPCPNGCGRNASIEFRYVKNPHASHILICSACEAKTKLKK